MAPWFADIQQLPLFMAAGLLLNITPGVDMALVLRSSAVSGRMRALTSRNARLVAPGLSSSLRWSLTKARFSL